MTVPVITASAGASWEARLAGHASADPELAVQLVRRCVDVLDLIAVSGLGIGRCVIVDARLPGLDRASVSAVTAESLAIVGITSDHVGEETLRACGVRVVVREDQPYADMIAAVRTALAGDAQPVSPLPTPSTGSGRVIAIWGAHGAPGRSTVAMSLADECAARGVATLLIDADVYGGSIGQMLGILDEAPGIVAATRLANEGRLDIGSLTECVRSLASGLMVLTGITRPQRWTELRPEAFVELVEVARSLAPLTVIDCASTIEQDEELFFDTMAPRRNGVTITALSVADRVLMVASADPVGMQRAIRLALSLPEEIPGLVPEIVVNRLRKASLPGGAHRDEVAHTVQRHLGRPPLAVIPSDRPACDQGLAEGRTLREVAASSPARQALRQLAALVAPQPQRHWLRKRSPSITSREHSEANEPAQGVDRGLRGSADLTPG